MPEVLPRRESEGEVMELKTEIILRCAKCLSNITEGASLHQSGKVSVDADGILSISVQPCPNCCKEKE